MLKKLSKSRKKKATPKLTTSQSKLTKQPIREQFQLKQHHVSGKHHNHQTSTLSLLSNHNASQTSIRDQSKIGNKSRNGRAKGRDSSAASLIMKESVNKDREKDKKKDKEKEKPKLPKQQKKSKKDGSSTANNKKTNPKSSPIKIAASDKNIRLAKQQASKKSKICNQEELYERINLGLYKSKTNSQINFSNSSSVRDYHDYHHAQQHYQNVSVGLVKRNGNGNGQSQGKSKYKKTLSIDCSDDYIINQYFSNSRIRNMDKKREEAAVKIQKVFRGYLTRKMLQQYINKQQERLQQLSRKAKSSSRQSLEFIAITNQHSANLPQLVDESNMFKKSSNTKMGPKMFSSPIDDCVASKKETEHKKQSSLYSEEDISMKNSKKGGLTPINHEALDEESSIYGHPQDNISRYLPEEMKSQELNSCSESLFYENVGHHEEDHFTKLKAMQDKSQELFKHTPSSYAYKSKVEDPMPTDFSDKRVDQFQIDGLKTKSKQLFQEVVEYRMQKDPNKSNNLQNFLTFKPEDKIITEQMVPEKIPVSKPKKKDEQERKTINLLKKQEKEKWSTIIEMLSQQISQSKSKSLENEKFMAMILEFSKKNKEELENSTFLNQNENQTKSQLQNQSQDQDHQIMTPNNGASKLQKNMDLPLRDKKYTNLSINVYNNYPPKQCIRRENSSILDKTEELKKFYKKNWVNYPIEEMVCIREKALEKRETDMVNRLNEELYANKLTHEQFIEKLAQEHNKFQNQRQLINKAKMEIFLGCRATHRLLQDSAKDAWYLGYKIPFSQSLKDFRNNNNDVWVKHLIVDELKSFSNSHKDANMSDQDVSQNQHQQSRSQQQNSLQTIEHSKQKWQDKRRQDLSISIPHEDSSLTIRPSNQVSQQSMLSQQISYNEGEVQLHMLEQAEQKTPILFYENQSDEDSLVDHERVEGFRRISPDLLDKRMKSQKYQQSGFEGPLLADVHEQQKNDKQVMKKILVNQQPPQIPIQKLQEIRKYEMTPRHKTLSISQPKSQIYKVQAQSQSQQECSQQNISSDNLDPQIKRITQVQIEALLWEAVSDLFTSNAIKNRLCKIKSKPPPIIDQQERSEFIYLLVGEIPAYAELLPRINQKMVASRLELLKFMRVSFEDDDQEEEEVDNLAQLSDSFQEIGKFQHILPAETCLSALEKYMKQEEARQIACLYIAEPEHIEKAVQQRYGSILPAQSLKIVVEREKVLANSQLQRLQLRKQIQKVEYHCIFDSLNQLLMKKRLHSPGYSGIGLNELTITIHAQNFKPMQLHQEQQFRKMLDSSTEDLQEILSKQKPVNEKLLLQNYEFLCRNDSQWVCYMDEALSFALEIVYMLEDQIFFQEAGVLLRGRGRV